jgi:2-C-methyl-D-erythritol 4-phosphate cytidylyltransferase
VTTLDSQRGDVAVIVAAGGAGMRLGAGVPKALCRFAGATLLQHAIRRLTAAGSVGWVVVAAPPGHEPAVRAMCGEATVVTGGAHRQQSVAFALAAVPSEYEIVLVHDAARALTPPTLVEDVAAAVRAGHDAVIPVLPVPDTMVQVDPTGAVTGPVDRGTLRAVQTPQGFRRAALEAAHAAATDHAATDDAGLVARLGLPVHTVPGSSLAFKITTSHDLTIAEAVVDAVSGAGG